MKRVPISNLFVCLAWLVWIGRHRESKWKISCKRGDNYEN
jgi:hypothetical protein